MYEPYEKATVEVWKEKVHLSASSLEDYALSGFAATFLVLSLMGNFA